MSKPSFHRSIHALKCLPWRTWSASRVTIERSSDRSHPGGRRRWLRGTGRTGTQERGGVGGGRGRGGGSGGGVSARLIISSWHDGCRHSTRTPIASDSTDIIPEVRREYYRVFVPDNITYNTEPMSESKRKESVFYYSILISNSYFQSFLVEPGVPPLYGQG